LNDSFFKDASSSRSWSGVLSFNSVAFIAIFLSTSLVGLLTSHLDSSGVHDECAL
jgi:hypothetical protein